jgi:hypothetical protein
LNFEPPQGVERSEAVANKSAHGEPVEPLERLERPIGFCGMTNSAMKKGINKILTVMSVSLDVCLLTGDPVADFFTQTLPFFPR